MSLLLIRHGETALNVARVLQPADTPLNERGVAQAEALARRLASLRVATIISSDLPRALRTAQAIAATTGAAIETSALLQERNFGDWRGQSYEARLNAIEFLRQAMWGLDRTSSRLQRFLEVVREPRR